MKKLIEKIKAWFTSEKVDVNPNDISEIKAIFKNVLNVIVAFKTAKAGDNKISTLEWGSIAKAGLPIVTNIKRYQLVKAQILDFTTAEGIELIQYCQELGILKEDATTVLTNAAQAIEGLIVIYKTNIIPIVNSIKK